MTKLVFLVCSERSGSNFITSLMNGHQAICGPPPTHLFRLFATNMDRYGDLQNDRNWSELVDHIIEAFSNMLGSWNCSINKVDIEREVNDRTSAAILKYIYQKEADLDNADYIFVKENHTSNFAPFLMAHFPECCFLISVRDPRDVALSWKKAAAMPGGVKQAVDTWLSDQAAALSLHSQLKGTDRCKLVRYEDLLQDTEGELEEILQWMGLTYQPEMLDYHLNSRTQRNSARIAAWSNLGTGILHQNHTNYLGQLGLEEIRYIELRCAELMRIFGYETAFDDIRFEAEHKEQEIAKLEKSMEEPSDELGPEEKSLRKKRLITIKKIISRRQQCLIKRQKK